MAVWYLDNDDEITDAVARLRAATDERVVFVVPSGSRIATGRINFKLLAREADSRALELAIASPDEQVRALAASAGVLALPSVDEAEAALERGDTPPQPGASHTAATTAAATTAAVAQDSSAPGAGRSRRRLGLALIAVLVVALVAGYGALQTFPTAEITLQPRVAMVGPVEVSVLASTAVTDTDVEGGRVPAVRLAIPLVIERAFEATGVEADSAAAVGEVVFSSRDTFQDIAEGTRVMTPSRIEFRTTELVTLRPPASGEDSASVVAQVVAIADGPEGNVAPSLITVAPSLQEQGISVTNPEATTGGHIEESPMITAADYDGAAADLNNRLEGALAAYLRVPENTPEGLTLFPDSARIGPVHLEPDADELVGSANAGFTLTASIDGSVLAVDVAHADDVARSRLTAAVPAGTSLLPETVTVEMGQGSADGSGVRFLGTARGEGYQRVDADALAEQIAGLPISEARAILETLGSTSVTVWPDFIGDLPGDTSRITLDVREPSTTE